MNGECKVKSVDQEKCAKYHTVAIAWGMHPQIVSGSAEVMYAGSRRE